MLTNVLVDGRRPPPPPPPHDGSVSTPLPPPLTGTAWRRRWTLTLRRTRRRRSGVRRQAPPAGRRPAPPWPRRRWRRWRRRRRQRQHTRRSQSRHPLELLLAAKQSTTAFKSPSPTPIGNNSLPLGWGSRRGEGGGEAGLGQDRTGRRSAALFFFSSFPAVFLLSLSL